MRVNSGTALRKPEATRTPRGARVAVPELTRGADIKPNKRDSLLCCSATISFADEAGAPSRYCLDGRIGRRGCSLAVVSVRLCRLDFRALRGAQCVFSIGNLKITGCTAGWWSQLGRPQAIR